MLEPQARTFVAAPPPPVRKVQPSLDPLSGKVQPRKRKGRAPNTKNVSKGRKKRKTKGKEKVTTDVDGSEESAVSSEEDEEEYGDSNNQTTSNVCRSSKRSKKLVAGGYREQSVPEDSGDSPETTGALTRPQDVQDSDQGSDANAIIAKDEPMDTELDNDVTAVDADMNLSPPEPESISAINVELEDDESKPKLMLKLGYSSFTIYGHCLCVVVEPWPPLPLPSKLSSVGDLRSRSLRAPSIAPAGFAPTESNASVRAQTPLFLPDRDETPAPFLRDTASHVPHFSASTSFPDELQDDDDGGMMQFSQVLNLTGDFRAGIADDDDGIDGVVFFGDADEARES